jgi:apolipoprotein N-acyltransferase
VRTLLGVIASGLMLGVYVRGEWAYLLGFVALVPWLYTLSAQHTWARVVGSACLMALAYTVAVFWWFGVAVGDYTQLGAVPGLLVLLLLAPVAQPQILAFALVRHAIGLGHPVRGALAGACAWVAVERLVPKLLSDILGYGLYPSPLLRQAADVVGSAGLGFLLLLANIGVALAMGRRRQGWRATLPPLGLAALVPLLLVGYGLLRTSTAPTPGPDASVLRVGMVQSNIVHYEAMRKEHGAYAAVRNILDTHFAMSFDAVERQHVDAVLWSETAYPTTLGHPKSPAGGELDRELLGTMQAAGVPFVFGTYDQDDAGEYNAAAFVNPGTGLAGMYRKTHPFPLTEYVPAWLDGPLRMQWLPWSGNWLPGNGARVFPLTLANGREVVVAPLICLDDVDTGLAIDAARLGAQALFTLSNDSWFTRQPLGAQLHQTVAAFRSIETGLPQYRVTTNGFSAAIDPTGRILASAPMGTRTLVIGELPIPPAGAGAPRTLMVAWGDWVGLACAAFLLLLAGNSAWSALPHTTRGAPAPVLTHARVALLSPTVRVVAGLLRASARLGLLGMGIAVLHDSALQSNTLAQLRIFCAVFLAPEALAWCLLQAFGARAHIADGVLHLARGAQHLHIALRDVAAVEPWHIPVPSAGLWLRLATGPRWGYGIASTQWRALVGTLSGTLANAGVAHTARPAPGWRARLQARTHAHLQARVAVPRARLARPLLGCVVLPLVLALVAFRLHQNIAFGSPLGEYYAAGWQAYLRTFGIWWAAWTMGVTLYAAALRAAMEAAALLVALVHPAQATPARRVLERLGLAALYIGLPVWFVMRLL